MYIITLHAFLLFNLCFNYEVMFLYNNFWQIFVTREQYNSITKSLYKHVKCAIIYMYIYIFLLKRTLPYFNKN